MQYLTQVSARSITYGLVLCTETTPIAHDTAALLWEQHPALPPGSQLGTTLRD